MTKYKPRLVVDLTPQQQARIHRLIPWGTARALYSTITDQILDVIEEHGQVAIAAIIERRISILDVLSLVSTKEAKQ